MSRGFEYSNLDCLEAEKVTISRFKCSLQNHVKDGDLAFSFVFRR